MILLPHQGNYENAIYGEKDHESAMRGLTVTMSDHVHVQAGASDNVQWTIQMGLSLMYALDIVPFFFACWFLYRVFSNIVREKIFVEENASCLLYYGILQCGASVFSPFLKVFICFFRKPDLQGQYLCFHRLRAAKRTYSRHCFFDSSIHHPLWNRFAG